MGQNDAPPSTIYTAAVGIWCVTWLVALMFRQYLLALLVILIGGPLLAWLLDQHRMGRHLN